MIRIAPNFAARSLARREPFFLRVVLTGLVCLLLTSAIVLAQRTNVNDAADAKARAKAQANAEIANAEARRKAQLAANRARLIPHYTQQGRAIVRAELLLVRSRCQLSNEQLRPISRETEQTLAEFVQEIVDQNTGLRPRGRSSSADATKQLQERVAIVIKRHLSSEQWALYKSEVDKRDASRKQAALNFLLDVMQRDLFLSKKQQEKLRESLSSHWDETWYLPVEYVLYGNQMYPTDMGQYLLPVLNEGQMRIWQRFQKVQGMWGLGNITIRADGEHDDLFADLGLVEKPQPKQNAK
jgi:hypothetical protein